MTKVLVDNEIFGFQIANGVLATLKLISLHHQNTRMLSLLISQILQIERFYVSSNSVTSNHSHNQKRLLKWKLSNNQPETVSVRIHTNKPTNASQF